MSVTYIVLNLLLQNEPLEAKKMESDSNDNGSNIRLIWPMLLRLCIISLQIDVK